jgi:hypothetical protein
VTLIGRCSRRNEEEEEEEGEEEDVIEGVQYEQGHHESPF